MEKNFKKDEIIFKQGKYESCMYDIVKGSVAIYSDYGTDAQKLLTTLSAGKCFGELGMIEAYPRSATAIAVEDTTLTVIDYSTFLSYFKEAPEKLIGIMQNVSNRIREVNADYFEACRTLEEAKAAKASGKEKSSWFNKMAEKFVRYYNNSREAN